LFRDEPFTSQSAVEAHEKAFEFFQGIPREIVYDQDVVFIHSENIGDYKLTDVFGSYLASRPFKAVFCHAADPESKGKVENVVKYIKQNFLYNRIFTNNETINAEAISWLNRTGNMMKHNTTCRVPYTEWCNEQKYLLAYHPIFSTDGSSGHKVLKTNTVKYRGNIYSLPFGTYKDDQTKVNVTESDNQLTISDSVGKVIASHLIPEGKGRTVINTSHRRNPSVKVSQLRDQTREFFSYSTDIETFLTNIERQYPRYVRDQLSALLICCEKHGLRNSEVALEFCIRNKIYSANDFKSVVESQASDKTTRQKALNIKPLGGPKTQMIAHIEPQKSDIREYESIFTPNPTDYEPVYTTN